MNTTTRLITLVATVAVLVIAFVVLSPGDDDPDPASTATVATAPPPPATTATTTTAAPAPPAAPKPRFVKIVVRGGGPVGGVKRIEVVKGERARFEITSADTTDHVHVHGYDLMRDLRAGGRARFSFTANAEGIFEIELEDIGVEIAKLVVQPG